VLYVKGHRYSGKNHLMEVEDNALILMILNR
jgi:hypothetical protein